MLKDIQSSKLYYSLVEAQLATGLSQYFWRELVQAGQIRFTRLGRRKIFIPASEIERIMEQKGEGDGSPKAGTDSQPNALRP